VSAGDLWSYIGGLREDLGRAEERIRELEERVSALEKDTPQARQLQRELDLTLADNAAAGYGDDYGPSVGASRHGSGCQCPYCYDDEVPS
jgi:hypothetical protein